MTTAPSSADIETEWTRLANLVPLVRYCLEPRASVEAGRGKPESRPPFNVNASKLLAEINEEVGFYVHVLMDETHDFRVPPTLEGRILAVRDRHGHFLGEDDQSGLDMLSCAETLNSRALGLAAPRPLPVWGGMCEVTNCGGDMLLRPSRGGTKCDRCGASLTAEEWHQMVEQAVSEWVAYKDEIVVALKTCGIKATPKALDHWISRGHITGREVPYLTNEGTVAMRTVFHMDEVIEYAKSRRENRRVAA